MKKTLLFFVFLIINFGGLYFGGILMGSSPGSNTWYINLQKAPWTPPGYFFGIAWTIIMILYSIYCARAFSSPLPKKTVGLFILQWILNVAWNPVFFNFHEILLGLLLLIVLFMTLILINKHLRLTLTSPATFLILPYLIWLCIAMSLNAYVLK